MQDINYGALSSAGMCIIKCAPPEINVVVMAKALFDCSSVNLTFFFFFFFLFISRYTYSDGVHVSVTAEAEGLFCGHNI